MPQFDQVDTFIGQVFWFIITFGILYVALVAYVLPRMAATFEQRSSKIDGDLATAEKMRQEAEDVRADYETQLAQAKAEAHEQARQVADEVAAEAAARSAELNAQLAEQAAKAEASIRAAREQALAELPAIAEEATAAMVDKLIGGVDRSTISGAISNNA